jgi:serine phosphatase RsbU (regulator of sigma subunit)
VVSPTTLRVLLVEDDDGDAFLFEELLSMADLDVAVRRERTVAEAEARLPSDVACVVLDLGLPDADGLAALHRLREAAPATPMLVLTGLSDTARGLEAVAAGAQDYLVKGRVDGELLARSIRYAVERQRAELVQAQLTAANMNAEENARLERGLLPRPLVADPRIAVATGYRPGRERALLGGDFYDVVESDDGTLHLLIGDVCGHDPDAAALGVCLRIAWRTLVISGTEPDRMFPAMDAVLVSERSSDEVFATVAMVRVDPSARNLRIGRAGHPLPLVVDAVASGVRPVSEDAAGVALGVVDGSTWQAVDQPVAAQGIVALFTDGLLEGYDGQAPGRRLGEAGLYALIEGLLARGLAGDQLLDTLLSEVRERNGGELTDDVAVVLLSWQGR